MSATATASTDTSTDFPGGELYVGNLHPDVNEATLHEKFKMVGPVMSLQVCRDAISRRSLGYAYVNYHTIKDAERAMDTLDYDILNGSPIRIMWSQRNPAIHNSGIGTLFVNNLDYNLDNKALYDIFSVFGNIRNCNVTLDVAGRSKGYGFIQFETEEAANKAIAKVNGIMLLGKKLYVNRFISRSGREKLLGYKDEAFNNLYFKHFPNELNEKDLIEMFGKFGRIASLRIMRNKDGMSKGCGFVAFEKHQSAEKAVNELNGQKIKEGMNVYVGRAQSKSERQLELKERFKSPSKGTNVYIKFLDHSINDEELRKMFEKYGTITSVKVMKENDRSRGFGFVCYSTPEQAYKAVAEMNGKIVGTKPLYVALAQRKEERKALLFEHYTQRQMNNRSQCINHTNSNSYLNMQNNSSTQGFFTPELMPRIPRWPIPQQIRKGAFGTLRYSGQLIPGRIGICTNHRSQLNTPQFENDDNPPIGMIPSRETTEDNN